MTNQKPREVGDLPDARRLACQRAWAEALGKASGYEADPCPWCGQCRLVRSREVAVCDCCHTVSATTARFVPTA